MVNELKSISEPIDNELRAFREFFRERMRSDTFLLDKILTYIMKRKGKQIRPMLVLLSAALNGEINEKTYRAASLIELLHTATLVHDDVVDESYVRRGAFSINALWKSKLAVLAGDYLLSRGMLLALNNKDFELLEITSEAVKLMSEGEILQLQKARTLDIRENVYFEVIRMKTASLFATSCSAGASSVGASAENSRLMWEFGINTGIAFQIRDDLLDFSPEESGKPKGVDLKEKKMTLPLIYSLKNSSGTEKRKIINLIGNSKSNHSGFDIIRGFIEEKKGFEYAEGVMSGYRDKAVRLLDIYPETPAKSSLVKLVNYVVERDR